MLKHFLNYLLFAFTMFAAADVSFGGGGGADGAADAGAGDGGAGVSDADADAGRDDAGADADVGDDAQQDAQADDLDADQQDAQRQQQERPEDKDTADLKGLVSKRLLALKKEAPELTAVFQKYPKVQEQIEASFRRDMAFRELFPTVAEARQLREQFPNGQADVDQLYQELGEVETLDKNFYGRDAQGNYSGHGTLIQNLFSDDRDAAVSLFKTVPKEWARLDPDSYNEVMGSVVAATLQRAEIPEWLTELRDAAKAAKQDSIAASIDKMLRWSQGFFKQKSQPTDDERRLQGQREQFNREKGERQKEEFTRFRTTFFSESSKQQQSIVRKHPAMTEMLATKAIPEAKKNEIVQKVQTKIREHLKGSRAFMSKLRPAYNSGNLQECLKLEKAQWSYPWILNKFVRAVLAEETPNLVRQNRERTRGAARPQGQTQNRGQQQREQKPTKPYKDGTVWKKPDGTRFTTAEILRGLHLQA